MSGLRPRGSGEVKWAKSGAAGSGVGGPGPPRQRELHVQNLGQMRQQGAGGRGARSRLGGLWQEACEESGSGSPGGRFQAGAGRSGPQEGSPGCLGLGRKVAGCGETGQQAPAGTHPLVSPRQPCPGALGGAAQASGASGVILGPVMWVAPGASLPAQALGNAAPLLPALPR